MSKASIKDRLRPELFTLHHDHNVFLSKGVTDSNLYFKFTVLVVRLKGGDPGNWTLDELMRGRTIA